MEIRGAILRTAVRLLVAVVVLVVGAGITVLAINRQDRPPSPEAEALAAVYDALPEVADDDNGYVYMLGLAAPRGTDPRDVGTARADWVRRLRANSALGIDSDPYPPGFDDGAVRTEFFDRCADVTRPRDCDSLLSDAGEALDAWLAEHAWLLARYETLTAHRDWRSIHTLDHRTPIPGLSTAAYLRRAWFLAAWARANRGDAAGVHAALAADLGFWRLVLAEADTLLTKLIAASMVGSHFERANPVLKRLPPADTQRAVPAAWREPISMRERALRRAFAFELQFARRQLELMRSQADPYATGPSVTVEPPTFLERLGNGVATRLLQPQDFVNKQARRFAHIAAVLEVPYARIPAAIEQLPDRVAADYGGWREPLYNPLGDALLDAAAGAHDRIAARIGDIEGVRRAALATIDLRRRGVVGADVAAALAAAELRNPYTGEAFGWDADAGEVVFIGLAPAPRARHTFWY